ncbi:hypothetical protein [Nostoc sp. ChiQUE01b]|uniref:hypothetical protein n=1 Tax=Nostoc sp. ChiQUE01b TaxID=3075376 RepID=UPI002AD2C7B2|nr:hypothetical protein [Nostoc sp. ChiQUE01b]MDZ8258025.1 hypothetical protein [Nostoc sp. ChiQUE01b]
MSVTLDPDLWRSASHRHQIQHLTAPFAAGATNTRVAISNAGVIDVTQFPGELLREPLLLITLTKAINTHRLKVEAVLNSTNPPTPLQPLEFAAYSEVGAALPLYRPPVNSNTQIASGFTITLTVTEFVSEQDTTGTTISPEIINQRLEAHLLQGLMGRMLYLLTAEKQRIRRQAREIVAMRSLILARDNALDRLGADLGVPRFVDFLRFRQPEPGQAPAIFNRFKFGELRFGSGFSGEIITEPRPEPDEEYRRRLAIYQPFLVPHRRQVVKLLNGYGTDTDPNRGLLSQLGFQRRFDIIEEGNDFGVAIHLIAVGDIELRTKFLDYIRNVYLILPNRNVATDQLHQNRPLPQARKQKIEQLRTSLNQAFTFETNAAIAPMLATTLDLVGRCRQALGITTPWQVVRTQDSRVQANGGSSRYELGLGVEVTLPTAAELNQMAAQRTNPNRPRADAEIEGLIQTMTPRSPNDDPEGRWLLEPCGIKTAHRTPGDRLYLSHLPTFGMEITGSANVATGNSTAFTARYNAPGDPGSNFVLATGLAAALTAWTTAGNAPWTVLSDTDARTVRGRAQVPGFAVRQILEASGLPTSDTPEKLTAVIQQLNLAPEDGGIPEDLFETIRLPTALATSILAGQDSAKASLRTLVRLLRQNGLSSALPLMTGSNEMVLVVGVTNLPGVGVNLSERRSSGFRWYVIPIYPSVSKHVIGTTGSRTQLTANSPGLLAVIAVGYARRGLVDPYQFRVQLPEDAVLSLQQYEFLMNLLQHLHPLGIEVDTFAIRQNNVDLDGDGNAEPLQTNVSQTYRQFRRSRYRGEDLTNLS